MKPPIMDKIELHSVIDLITNSSTEIFVHSDNSIKPLKELINEILKLMYVKEFCDELFDISLEFIGIEEFIEYQLDYSYREHRTILDSIGSTNEERKENLKQLITDIKFNNKEEPEWFKCDHVYYNIESKIVIKTKDHKFDKLLELLKTFLYSPKYYEHSSE